MTSASYRLGAQVGATPAKVASTVEGSREFASLFAQHAGYVIGLLRRLGVRSADVQDAAQEVFVVVHRKLPDFEGRSSIKTWLCGIAAHVASNQRRRAQHRREDWTVTPEPIADTARDAWGELVAARDRAALLAALDALPPKLRDVIVLHEIEELAMSDVVAIVECPLFTGYTRLRAARKALRKQLRALGYGEPAHD